MEFKVRVTKTGVILTSVPKDYGKPGFIKRLPKALAKRPRKVFDKFIDDELECGNYTVVIEKDRNGAYVVGEISFGSRKEEKVTYKTKVLINRNNGVGIRFCPVPAELIGKRVSIDIY